MTKNPQLKKIEELESQLEILQEQLQEGENAKVRALADLQNFQRREAENKKNWVSLGIAEFLKSILPRFTELKIGVEHSNDTDIQKVVENFFTELQKLGVQVIAPHKGDIVDPELHEVLMTEDGTPGTIVRTLESGWKFGDIVLTPAKVSATQN